MNSSTALEQFRALGDPVRWAIVRRLRDGTCCACDLAEVVGVSAPLLSHHLRVLRDAGLVRGTRRGRWVDYRLDTEVMERLAGEIRKTEVDL